MLSPEVERIAKECKARLAAHYGERLAGVWVYGSRARGDATEDSDLDLLVVLKDEFRLFDEIRAIVEVLYPLQLDSQWLISAKPATQFELLESGRRFYRNVLTEGVAV